MNRAIKSLLSTVSIFALSLSTSHSVAHADTEVVLQQQDEEWGEIIPLEVQEIASDSALSPASEQSVPHADTEVALQQQDTEEWGELIPVRKHEVSPEYTISNEAIIGTALLVGVACAAIWVHFPGQISEESSEKRPFNPSPPTKPSDFCRF